MNTDSHAPVDLPTGAVHNFVTSLPPLFNYLGNTEIAYNVTAIKNVQALLILYHAHESFYAPHVEVHSVMFNDRDALSELYTLAGFDVVFERMFGHLYLCYVIGQFNQFHRCISSGKDKLETFRLG